jgi:hypothetical protein
MKDKRYKANGMYKTPTHNSWMMMWQRCSNENRDTYNRYGGRKIGISIKWKDFATFLKDMGERPKGMTLERIDNNKGYSPSNCKWANKTEQARNRSSTKELTYNGKTQCLTAWAKDIGITPSAITYRMKSRKSIDRILAPKGT